MKRAVSSDSAAEEMMNLMILRKVRSQPLLAGMCMSSEINMWAPVWMRDMISLIKDALECPARNIMMAQ